MMGRTIRSDAPHAVVSVGAGMMSSTAGSKDKLLDVFYGIYRQDADQVLHEPPLRLHACPAQRLSPRKVRQLAQDVPGRPQLS